MQEEAATGASWRCECLFELPLPAALEAKSLAEEEEGEEEASAIVLAPASRPGRAIVVGSDGFGRLFAAGLPSLNLKPGCRGGGHGTMVASMFSSRSCSRVSAHRSGMWWRTRGTTHGRGKQSGGDVRGSGVRSRTADAPPLCCHSRGFIFWYSLLIPSYRCTDVIAWHVWPVARCQWPPYVSLRCS
jgi:hypothetical protein